MKKLLLIALLLVTGMRSGRSQEQSSVAAKLGYPELVVYNGKIVTMDDASFEARVGTIVQAMAIRNGKILATGTNAQIQVLAGPKTLSIDLKGRTVLPGFIATHEHPTDWAFIEPRAFRHVLPNDDTFIARWMEGAPPNEQLVKFEPTMREAVAKAKPGQWILINFSWGRDYEWSEEMQPLFRKSITKDWLDQLAPNNPAKVKDGLVNSISNQKAIEELRSVHPTLSVISDNPTGVEQFLKTGFGFSRPMEPDAMFKGKTSLLAQILKAEMEWWASYGFTTFASSPYTYRNFQALDYLDKRGDMPARFAWGYIGPDWSIETLRYLAGMLGHGTDYLWFSGAWDDSGGDCMSVPLRPQAEIPSNLNLTRCNFAPGTRGRETLELIVKSGLRIATMHSGGDKDIDYFMDAIEHASQEAGFTWEEIRAKRHAFDHGGGAPRPQQIPRIKKLGIMPSENNTLIWLPAWRGAAELIANAFGIEYTSWVVPRKTLADAGVMTSFEIDRPLPYKLFYFITKGMNRYNDRTQKLYGPDQKTDRAIQLKALTRWGAYYVLRENTLGTLEPGKLADFVVLDKDILTIPEEQIPNIQVLMTAVGGKVTHLSASLAREVGKEPVGATTWKEEIPAGW